MWNEKKFFQDFVEESEKVKPDEEFVKQLKKLAGNNEIKKKKAYVTIMKYSILAASLLLCVVIGGVVWNTCNDTSKKSDKETESNMMDIHAGNQNHGIHSGIIGEESDLEEVIALVSDDTVILEDENGEELSSAKRKLLLKQLNGAEKTDENISLPEKYTSYFCNDKEKIEIKVYNSEYVVIGNSKIIYHIN